METEKNEKTTEETSEASGKKDILAERLERAAERQDKTFAGEGKEVRK